MRKYNLHLLTWFIIPTIFVFLTISYLVGALQKPEMENAASTDSVLGISTLGTIEQAAFPSVDLGRGAVTLWFDDGWMTQYDVGFEVLNKYGLKGAIAIPTHLIGYPAYMNWTQVRSLAHNGWEITSHSRNHNCDEDKFTPSLLESEMLGAKQDLLALGLTADHYVTPCGVQTDNVVEVAKKYYFSLRTSTNGINALPLKDAYHIKSEVINKTHTIDEVKRWIEKTKEQKGWLILTFHQISDDSSTNYGVTTQLFEEMVKAVKDSELPVVLPTQVITK